MNLEREVKKVKKNGFPFMRKLFDKKDLFARLQHTEDEFYNPDSYELRSYYPKFGHFSQGTLNGKYIWIKRADSSVFPNCLTDLYVEEIRLKARRKDQAKSSLELWDDRIFMASVAKTIPRKKMSLWEIREWWRTTVPETTLFPISWARTIIKMLLKDTVGKMWLDISAGWGDRLLTAMSLDMIYLGFDPNLDLQPKYSEMIRDFGNPKYYRVVPEPFEIQSWDSEIFDIVFSSPPYFDLEIYSEHDGQSIKTFGNVDEWLVKFLFPSLKSAFSALKTGGFFCLHIGDSRDLVTFTEPALLFMRDVLGANILGNLGVSTWGRFIRPLWLFRKDVGEFRKDDFRLCYPELLKSWNELEYPTKRSPVPSVDGWRES